MIVESRFSNPHERERQDTVMPGPLALDLMLQMLLMTPNGSFGNQRVQFFLEDPANPGRATVVGAHLEKPNTARKEAQLRRAMTFVTSHGIASFRYEEGFLDPWQRELFHESARWPGGSISTANALIKHARTVRLQVAEDLVGATNPTFSIGAASFSSPRPNLPELEHALYLPDDPVTHDTSYGQSGTLSSSAGKGKRRIHPILLGTGLALVMLTAGCDYDGDSRTFCDDGTARSTTFGCTLHDYTPAYKEEQSQQKLEEQRRAKEKEAWLAELKKTQGLNWDYKPTCYDWPNFYTRIERPCDQYGN